MNHRSRVLLFALVFSCPLPLSLRAADTKIALDIAQINNGPLPYERKR